MPTPAGNTDDLPPDPFPARRGVRVTGFLYDDHLNIIRYNRRIAGSDPDADWQLVADYSVTIGLAYEDDSGATVTDEQVLTVPAGFYTDLSSIPAAARWIVSKSGPHLEASIVHDWLYRAWTDYRLGSRRLSDWVFADDVMAAGLRQLRDYSGFKRGVVLFAVRLFGWWPFFGVWPYTSKRTPLAEHMAVWRQHLEDHGDGTPVPPEKRLKRRVPVGSHLYNGFIVIWSLVILLYGLATAWLWFGPGCAADAGATGLACGLHGALEWAVTTLIWATGLIVAAAVVIFAVIRGYVALRR